MPCESRPTALADGQADDRLLAFVDAVLAQATAEDSVRAAETRSYLVFLLGEARYAIPVASCREIVRVGDIARIPESPPEVRGVFNLRGRVVPVIELRLRVGLDAASVTACSRLVVVEAKGRLFGLLVDHVLGISKVTVADIGAEPAASQCDVVVGRITIGAQILVLLDPDRILWTSRGDKP